MTDRDEQIAPLASRRAVLLGVGALGAAGVLAGCGTGADPAAPGGGNGAPPAGGASDPAGGAMKAADIPVGGSRDGRHRGLRAAVTAMSGASASHSPAARHPTARRPGCGQAPFRYAAPSRRG